MWRFTTTLIFIIIIIISLTVKWDTLSPGLDSPCLHEIHEQGALEEGTSTVEACVTGLWAMAGWGPQLVKSQGATWGRQQISKPEGDLIRVVVEVAEAGGALLRFQEGLGWFRPEPVSELRVMGLSCCLSYINNICPHTYTQQKINNEIKPNPNKHRRNSAIIKQSLGTLCFEYFLPSFLFSMYACTYFIEIGSHVPYAFKNSALCYGHYYIESYRSMTLYFNSCIVFQDMCYHYLYKIPTIFGHLY